MELFLFIFKRIMSLELQKALEGLQRASAEGANILLEQCRIRALYPDLDAMEKRTKIISRRQAAIPINEADKDMEHLLHHIDMLKKELREKS